MTNITIPTKGYILRGEYGQTLTIICDATGTTTLDDATAITAYFTKPSGTSFTHTLASGDIVIVTAATGEITVTVTDDDLDETGDYEVEVVVDKGSDVRFKYGISTLSIGRSISP